MSEFVKGILTIGSSATIGFGIWHFFVPKLWNWYSYIDSSATELELAIRAINVFFSLSLILFGLINLVFIYSGKADRFSILIILFATCILWFTRVLFQIVSPQGSINPILQYGMLTGFIIVFICYALSLVIYLMQKTSY